MENASKALIMAGSILISLLVISLIVVGYTQLSDYQQQLDDTQQVTTDTEFMHQIEQFNRTLYGSELLSLANKMEDYNIKQADAQGYQEISMSATLTPPIGAQVYTATSYTAETLTQCYNELAQKIRDANETINGKNISYWAGSSSEVRRTFTDTTNPTYDEIREKITNYNALVGERDDISRKTFKCTHVEYDQYNGRIIKMEFEEE